MQGRAQGRGGGLVQGRAQGRPSRLGTRLASRLGFLGPSSSPSSLRLVAFSSSSMRTPWMGLSHGLHWHLPLRSYSSCHTYECKGADAYVVYHPKGYEMDSGRGKHAPFESMVTWRIMEYETCLVGWVVLHHLPPLEKGRPRS